MERVWQPTWQRIVEVVVHPAAGYNKEKLIHSLIRRKMEQLFLEKYIIDRVLYFALILYEVIPGKDREAGENYPR